MREKGKTSIHLLLASIVTMFGVMLILITMSGVCISEGSAPKLSMKICVPDC